MRSGGGVRSLPLHLLSCSIESQLFRQFLPIYLCVWMPLHHFTILCNPRLFDYPIRFTGVADIYVLARYLFILSRLPCSRNLNGYTSHYPLIHSRGDALVRYQFTVSSSTSRARTQYVQCSHQACKVYSRIIRIDYFY